MSQFVKSILFRKERALLALAITILTVGFIGTVFYVNQTDRASAMLANHITNTGAPADWIKASDPDQLVMDFTLPDAWNGNSFTADTLIQNGSSSFWQGDVLNAFTALGTTASVGFDDENADGNFDSGEMVVIDLDADGVWTSAADTLVDADGVATTGAGTTALAAGTAFFDIIGGDLVGADNAATPTQVWHDYDGSDQYTGAFSIGSTVSGAGDDGDIGAAVETLTNAKVSGGDGVMSLNEGVYVSATTTFTAGDTIILGEVLEPLTNTKLSGDDDLYTNGEVVVAGSADGIVNTGDIRVTDYTGNGGRNLAASSQSADITSSSNHGLSVNNIVKFTTLSSDTTVAAIVSDDNGTGDVATQFRVDVGPQIILGSGAKFTQQSRSDSATTRTASAVANAITSNIASVVTVTVDPTGDFAAGDVVKVTGGPASPGESAFFVVTAIDAGTPSITVIGPTAGTDNTSATITKQTLSPLTEFGGTLSSGSADNKAVRTTVAAGDGDYQVVVGNTLTNAAVSAVASNNALDATLEGVYVSTDGLLDAADTVILGTTIAALTNGMVTLFGPANGTYEVGENVYVDADVSSTVTDGDTRVNEISAESCVLGTCLDGTNDINPENTAGWVKEINAQWAVGNDVFIENFAGELTYSASPDTDVYATISGALAGDPLIDFPADCNGDGTVEPCKFTGSAPIDSTEDIYEDDGNGPSNTTNANAGTGTASDNSYVDRRDDLLTALTIENTGTATDDGAGGADLTNVHLWLDAGAAGFQGSGTDTDLGPFTRVTDSTWSLSALTQAIANDGQRFFVTVDTTANPTNGETVIMQIPVLADAATVGSFDADDTGVFVGSVNDGPGDSVILNANTSTIDTVAPTISTRSYTDSGNNKVVERVTVTFGEPISYTYEAGDWLMAANGSGFTVGTTSAGSASVATTLNLDVSWDAGKTGPDISTNQPTLEFAFQGANDVVDRAGNTLAASAATAMADLAEPAITAVARNKTATKNTLEITYSEPVTITNSNGTASAGGASIASDATIGNITDDGGLIVNGVVEFVAGDTRSTTGQNSLALSASGLVLTITVCGESGPCYLTASDAVGEGAATELSGNATALTGITDASTNAMNTLVASVTSTSSSVWDVAAPTISARGTRDNTSSPNGVLDGIEVTMSGNILDSTATSNDFDVQTVTGETFSTTLAADADADDEKFTVTFTEGGTWATDATPTIAYTRDCDLIGTNTCTTGDADLTDSFGNLVASSTATATTDTAGPAILKAATSVSGSGTTVNRLVLTFSEPVTVTDGDLGNGFPAISTLTPSVGGVSIDAGNYSDTGTTLTLNITPTGDGVDNTAVTFIPIYTQAPAGLIRDNSTAQNEMADGETVTAGTDEAGPVILSAVYQDNGSNGSVDRVLVTFTEDVSTSTYEDGDWTVTAAGSIGVTDETAAALATTTITFTVTANANQTGGAIPPAIAYSQTNGTADSIIDGPGNPMTDLASYALGDSAGPVAISGTYEDTNADGQVDRLDILLTTESSYTCTAIVANDWSAGDVGTVTLAADPAGACTISTATLQLPWLGKVAGEDSTGGATDPVISYTDADLDNSIVDGSNNDLVVSSLTITDGAGPVIRTMTTMDDDSDGQVDMLVATWTEDVDDSSFDAGQDSITAGAITLSGALAAPGVDATDDDITYVGVTEVGSGDTDVTGTYSAGAGTIDDALLNASGADTSQSVTDNARPAFMSAEATSSTNIEITMSETINAVNFGAASDWTATSLTSTGVAINGGDATKLDLTVSALGNTAYTASDFAFVTTGGAFIRDAVPNATVAFSGKSITDGQAPAFVSARYLGNSGQVETVEITFSETITTNSGVIGEFTYVANDITSSALAGGSAGGQTGVAAITLTLGTPGDSGITSHTTPPTIAYTDAGGTIADTAGNQASNFTAQDLSDGAAPALLTGSTAIGTVYQDSDGDGVIDRIKLNFTEDVLLENTVLSSDFNPFVSGTFNGSLTGNASISSGDVLISLTGADADETGSTTTPTIAYVDGAVRAIEDAAGNDVVSFAASNLYDGAAPVIKSTAGRYTLDNDNNGTVDFVKIVYTESVEDGSVSAGDYCVSKTSGECSVGHLNETFTSTIPNSGNETDTGSDATIYIGVATGSQPLNVNTTNVTLVVTEIGSINDASGNASAGSAATNSTDGAAPIMYAGVYSDSNADGKVDTVTLTYSESVTFVVEAGDWSFSTAGSINLTGDFAAAECTTGSTTIVCTDAGTGDFDADANETGGATNPIWTYSNAGTGGSVTDGANAALGQAQIITDGARPILLSSSPANGGVLIPATANFTLTFSEDLTTSAESTSNIVVTASSGTPTWTLAESSGVVTVDPSGSTFSPGVTATVTVGTGVVDGSGNTYNTAGTAALEPYSFTTQNPSSSGGGGGGGGGSSTVSVTADAVTVTSPNGGEVLTGGAQADLTWTSTGNVNNIMLYYSVDGGSAFGLIAAGTANDGSYTWTVPNTATGQALIKIVGRDAGGATLATDQSNATFTINTNSVLPIAEAPSGSGDVSVPAGSMSRVDAEAALPSGIDVDNLVRVVDDGDPTTDFDTTVYYVGLDAKRHPFVNAQVYFTWYENFDMVQVIDGSVLTEIGLGSPVLTRPGTMMVKIQSDPRTFAVTPGDYTIRWVPSEEVAIALFGSTWNQRIMDIEPTYWSRFTMGADLTVDLHPAGSVIKDADGTKYYFDGVNKRAFATDEAFSANMFQNKYVIDMPASAGWSSTTAGSAIMGFEDGLFSLQR